MNDTISLYKKLLNLEDATIELVTHDDAIVATVFKVTKPNSAPCILKICAQKNHFLRELYYLTRFTGKILVPKIVHIVEPTEHVHGAILMQCLPGSVLNQSDVTKELAYEMGTILARIHSNKLPSFGDLINPKKLTKDPCQPFMLKFEEGLAECKAHLPKELWMLCKTYAHNHIHLLSCVDGPCLIHRDFRPGNVIVDHSQLQGIIDWSSAKAGFAEEDFCPLENGEWSSDPLIKSSFLSGYATIRSVPDYSKIMPLLLLSRTIASLGFLIRRGIWQNSSANLYAKCRKFLDAFFSQ